MYPYHQNPKENIDLFTAAVQPEPYQQSALEDYLRQNPATGTLLFQVTGGQGAFPVENAKIVISKVLDDQQAFSTTVLTNASGKSEVLTLPAPSKSLSQSPGNGTVFSTYQATITAPGYVTIEIPAVPIFADVTTIQPVNMSSNLGRTQTNQVERIEDIEPEL